MNAEGSIRPDATCDGGDLDCGSGLLLIIRNAMQPLPPGGLLEVRSREISVKEDLRPGAGWSATRWLQYSLAKEPIRITTSASNSRTRHLRQISTTARSFVWSARVRWTEGMQARAFIRNHAFNVGQPASFDTQDVAPSAFEYVLAAIGGCLAVGFQWRASQRGIEVRNLEVSLQAQADNILVFLGLEEQRPSRHESRFEGRLYVDADG